MSCRFCPFCLFAPNIKVLLFAAAQACSLPED
jgi:hypothetical protein